MKYRITLSLLLLALFPVRSPAQDPPSEQRQEKSDERVIVTTNLVQVDAIVTDKDGRQVKDLRPEDFELIEDGNARQIIAFSYMPLDGSGTSTLVDAKGAKGTSASESVKGKPEKSALQVIPERLRPESVRRVIAIVVDDFGLSFESIARLRSALEAFIHEHTSPSDLIAVIRTSGGEGAMQQFTSNRARILATIRRIRWYPTGRGGMSAIDSIRPLDNDDNGVQLRGYSTSRPPDLSSKEFHGGSLGALGFVIEGLARFPGRKSIVLISDNLPLTTREALVNGVASVLNKLVERANQYSIVISTMDARGLPKAGLTADDNQYNLAANQVDKRSRDRRITFNVEQDTLSYLATQTGGMFVHNNNNLNAGIRRIVDSEEGYYLLAYRPEDAADAGRTRLYKVTLRLKRPGLLLRTRSGFHRFRKSLEANSAARTKDELLREALVSPFVKEDVHLKATALFTGNSQIKIMLHVDARDLELTKSPDGSYTGSFDIAAVAFDDNAKVAMQVGRTQTLRVQSSGYERLLRDGLVSAITMPVKAAGPYQLRIALRDVSGRVGSDGQFVEVPDPKKTRLTLAGFIVHAVDQSANAGAPESNAALTDRADSTARGPAVRKFAAGDTLEYSYLVYGARLNDDTHLPNLLSQIRLFRKSEEVFTGSLTPIAIAGNWNHEGFLAGGSLKLGTGLALGEYFLQVIVTDKLAPVERQTTEQWIDFEIVR